MSFVTYRIVCVLLILVNPDVDPDYDNSHSRTRAMKDRGFFDSIRDPLILAGLHLFLFIFAMSYT